MDHRIRIVAVLGLGLALLTEGAFAARYYPRGYGRFGWGGWGQDARDPAAGYMAGLGAFARGQGVYEVEDAKAQAINIETMKKWNQELRARQQELLEERRQAQAEQDAQLNARVQRMALEDGTTLNNLLMRILDLDPSAVRSSRAPAPINASAVREVPFEWNTEAITICIDQLTARSALPEPLGEPPFATQRAALGKAVEAALQEDARGDVSPATMRRLTSAIAALRAQFVKVVPTDDPDYASGDDYFGTLASLARMLHDPSMKKALGELESIREIDVGDLIAFMQAYNLRFGAVSTTRQLEIYKMLADRLTTVANELSAAQVQAPPVPSPPPPGFRAQGGKGLQNAARGALKEMDWQQLDAHDRQP